MKLDISKARTYLQWYPVYDVYKAINKTIEWYKIYYENNNEDMYEYTLKQIEEYEREAKIKNMKWSE
ncbi:hypothetical protein [Caloramator sp. mosi_1]|uniref:hypothetical protein n=1 Tax=Caloramator sp. mosi_1 TaxID=3023090 RepID=UPI0030812D67